jgi:uncharacterized protein (TIGR02646 family)
MRKIQRLPLTAKTEKALRRKQAAANRKKAAGALNVETTWKSARQTIPVKAALVVLQKMAGNRQRCMYCGDSHGTDIEHFWPKKPYPERMFRWPNMLLCCTECGRFKGDDFPLANDSPLLVDPTSEDPWQFIDFDPDTGNIVARFDITTSNWLAKGAETVKALHLDCREALSASYQQSHRRIKSRVEGALQTREPDAKALITALREADDHGLLGWYFTGTGANLEPFASFHQNHPAVWQACVQSLIG